MNSTIREDIDLIPFELLDGILEFFRMYKASKLKINVKPFIKDKYFNDNCVICTEKFKENEDVSDLKCKHAFHKACIKQWCKRKMHCPLCNEPLHISEKKETVELSISMLLDL